MVDKVYTMDIKEPIVYDLKTSTSAIRYELKSNGYVAVRVMNPCDAIALKLKFMAWLKALDPLVSTRSWDRMPDQVRGIIKAYGIGQAPFMWELRNHPRVRQAFRVALNDHVNELVPSFDGVCFHPANLSENKEQTRMWPHIDLHPSKHADSKQLTIQSSISLIGNMHKTDGGFVVWPRTHTLGLDFYRRKMPEAVRSMQGDYFPLPHAVAAKLGPPKMIHVPAGTMVMWDSRLVHCNMPPISKRESHDRLVAFVCMVPKPLVSPETLRLLEEWRRTGRTTSHSPINPRANAEQVVYHTTTTIRP